MATWTEAIVLPPVSNRGKMGDAVIILNPVPLQQPAIAAGNNGFEYRQTLIVPDLKMRWGF